MANLVNTKSAVAVRDAQKNGNLIHIEPNEVKNLKAGNRYELNGKELFIVSSFNPKNKEGSRTGYRIVWDGQEFICEDVTKLQKLVTGKTAREAGYSQKKGGNNPINGFIPSSRKEAREKAREWTSNAIKKVSDSAKMFSVNDDEIAILKGIAIRYYRSKLSDLYERYETDAKEKADKAAARRLHTVEGQRERADKAEAELARARAMLAELGVTL